MEGSVANNKTPNQKQPGEKDPGTFHYNPGNMSGKELAKSPKTGLVLSVNCRTAALGGHVTLRAALAQLQAGTINAHAVTAGNPLSIVTDVPTA
jgi:hypothetical protein